MNTKDLDRALRFKAAMQSIDDEMARARADDQPRELLRLQRAVLNHWMALNHGVHYCADGTLAAYEPDDPERAKEVTRCAEVVASASRFWAESKLDA